MHMLFLTELVARLCTNAFLFAYFQMLQDWIEIVVKGLDVYSCMSDISSRFPDNDKGACAPEWIRLMSQALHWEYSARWTCPWLQAGKPMQALSAYILPLFPRLDGLASFVTCCLNMSYCSNMQTKR